MYLSQLVLSPRSRQVQHDLGDVHAMHRRVMSGFVDATDSGGVPPLNAREEHSVLYRLETTQGGGVCVLVQADELPNWDKLPSGYLDEALGLNPAHKEIGAMLSQLKSGQRVRFRLRANATKRLPAGEEGARGKRVEVLGEQRLLQWLLQKCERAGFALRRVVETLDVPGIADFAIRIMEEPKLRGHRSGTLLTFGSAIFDGELLITDPDLFRETVRRGIGTAKAYGFGLLSIAPAST